jgi:hypothetical protein
MLAKSVLPRSAMRGDLDRLYAERLLELVRNSSLGAAVLLAHDRVYADDGKIMENVGSFSRPQTITSWSSRASILNSCLRSPFILAVPTPWRTRPLPWPAGRP